MCSATLTLTILATQRQICCLSREKCAFFPFSFLVFFFSFFSSHCRGNLVVCSRDDFRWKKVVPYSHEHSMLQAGKALPSHHLLLQFREMLGMITPIPLHPKVPWSLFAALLTSSKNSSAAAQGAWNRARPAVGAWTASKGRESALKLQITSFWRRIFRNGLALSLYFSISVAISQLCLLAASTGCSFPLKDLYQS